MEESKGVVPQATFRHGGNTSDHLTWRREVNGSWWAKAKEKLLQNILYYMV